MKVVKTILRILGYILFVLLLLVIIIAIWHHINNNITKKNISVPGDRIEIYDKEYIHAVKMGTGDYTIVILPGMGTASPYYDFYKLATELSKNNQVIVMEPFGYGYSDNTDKDRSLKNYDYELSKVLEYYSINNNIILLGHSYSGISNFNYAKHHEEVKGIICLDCTNAHQIETHVKDGKFKEKVPKQPEIYSIVSPLGISRFVYSTFLAKDVEKTLLVDIPSEYHEAYKYFLYNKTLNKTIINEVNSIYYNQLEILEDKYREDLYVATILSDETIKEMKEYKKEGDFNQDWEEMHILLITNPKIQKMYTLKGDHYIHHNNVKEINEIINNMIDEMKEETIN